jgi:Flp pilus assembly protein TadG
MTRRRHIEKLRAERGQTAVEFALVAPVLILLLLGVVQMGIAFNNYVTVTDAARAGARKAIVARLSGLTTSDITQAVQSAASDLNQTKLGVTVADPSDPTWSTAGSTITVTVTYPYSISLLGMVVSSGNLTSTMTDRLE